jgi:hypothetical protein
MKIFTSPRFITSLFLFVAIQTFLNIAPGLAYVSIASSPVTGLLNPTDPLNSNDDFYLYFEGTDHGLYKIACDDAELKPGTCDEINDRTATEATRLGGTDVLAYSSPCVLYDHKDTTQGHIFYQGINNELYRMNLDGTEVVDLGVQTFSTPCAIWESFYKNGAWMPLSESVYFQGADNELCKVCGDGTEVIHFRVQAFSAPCAVNVVDKETASATTNIFYQGAANALNKFDVLKFSTDPANSVTFLNNRTKSTPAVKYGESKYILFQSAQNELCKVDSNGNNTTHTNQEILSSPCIRFQSQEFREFYLLTLFQGADNNLITLLEYQSGDAYFNLTSYHAKSTPCSIVRNERYTWMHMTDHHYVNYICFQNSDHRLQVISKNLHDFFQTNK